MAADLPERDLGPVAALLPALDAAVRAWFRPQLSGFEHVPDGPVLFVANHSGGFGSPDSAVFALAYLRRYGVDAPLYWLGHSLLLALPGVGELMRRCGVIEASPAAALAALRGGGSVVVYPGGERELHRPWTARHEVRFAGRTGWARLARRAGVPVVPVVAHGGHDSYLPLADGHRVARALRLDRLLRLETFPVALALPWGLEVGGLVPHLPLPVTIRMALLPPVDVGGYADERAAYDDVVARMQAALRRLAAGDDT